ncbi:hypothetical protein Tco_0194547 [Tanacetum coccineum]
MDNVQRSSRSNDDAVDYGYVWFKQQVVKYSFTSRKSSKSLTQLGRGTLVLLGRKRSKVRHGCDKKGKNDLDIEDDATYRSLVELHGLKGSIRFKGCPIHDKNKKCRAYGFLDLELTSDYYKRLLYDLHEDNKALKRMNKMSGVMEDSSKRLPNNSNNPLNPNSQKKQLIIKMAKGKEFIILSSDSSTDEDTIEVPSIASLPKERLSIVRVPKEGPSQECSTDKDTTNKDSNDKDTIDESYSPNSKESGNLGIVQTKEMGKERFEVEADVNGS